MQDCYTPKGRHLTLADRKNIERWLKQGLSHRKVASLLAKAPQTIHNEVQRGQVRQQVRPGKFEMVYSAGFAQSQYEENHKRSVKQTTLTKELKTRIVHYMKQHYSPEKGD